MNKLDDLTNLCAECGKRSLIGSIHACESSNNNPIAWVRFCSDGTYEGPVMDCDKRMDGTRRTSGAWTPLYAAPSTAEQASDVRNAATRDTERDALVKQFGDCCMGADPFCAGGCLVEKAIRKSATPADKGNAPAEAIEAWISVNDSLPELNIDEPETIANGFRSAAHKMSERCLVVVNGHVTESKLLLSADRPAVPIWTMLQSDKVTHWMYVPAAPSQGVKNNG